MKLANIRACLIALAIESHHEVFGFLNSVRLTSKQQLVGNGIAFHHAHGKPHSILSSTSASDKTSQSDNVDDSELLNQVSNDQLQGLCDQFGISNKGNKEQLLSRLRQFAETQAKEDEERRKRQVQRIQLGVDDTQGNSRKAKHKIVSSDDSSSNDDADGGMEGSFYFSIPGDEKKKRKQKVKVSSTKIMNPQNSPMDTITAPLPPPGLEPNENGERTVTVYSTKDQNDLTGMAAQNSVNSANDAAMNGGYSRTDSMGKGPENTLAGGPFGDQSGSQRKKASSKEFDEACEVLGDLVLSLLQMTGAPGFQDEFTDGIVPLEENERENPNEDRVNYHTEFGFIGFDPSRVPHVLITQATKSLRVRNGKALQQVLNDFEMQAIGFDGIKGDNKEKGGGHYLELQKVGTFLEGFRKAEVRRIARETSTMLLDKLVTEGVKSLDQMLITMTKGTDDTSEAGELNDSLVNYLEEAVKQQEIKVEQKLGEQALHECQINTLSGIEKGEVPGGLSDSFWNMTLDDNGEVVESLDPNDPVVKAALKRELEIAQQKFEGRQMSMPTDPAQQLLVLLTLLKERVKAEALFSSDEKGRNLRILAYCLHASNQRERESVIMDNLGNNLDVSSIIATFLFHFLVSCFLTYIFKTESGFFLRVVAKLYRFCREYYLSVATFQINKVKLTNVEEYNGHCRRHERKTGLESLGNIKTTKRCMAIANINK